MTDNPTTREAYDQWAATYDSAPNPTRDLDAQELRSDLRERLLGDVLEVGCGTGKNTEWLVDHSHSVTGLELSKGMLERCRTRAPAARLLAADLTAKWPVEDLGFDWVLADLVLEHIEDLDHIAREAARVVRRGGRLRISEYHPSRQALGKAAYFMDGERKVEPPAFVHTKEEFRRAFEAAGFTLDSMSDRHASRDPKDGPPRVLVAEFRRTG